MRVDRLKAILFDLDGTLIDPKVGITRCLRHALESLGREAPPPDALEWCIGPPLRDSLLRLLDGDERLADEGVRLYRERYSERGLHEHMVYDGVPEMLAEAEAFGIPLLVATSKPGVFAERILTNFGLRVRFRAIHGAELDGTRSRKAELIAHVLATHGLEASSTVMIGDREHDALGARAVGVRALGVRWGYGSDEELRAAGVEDLLARPGDLGPWLRATGA